MRAGRALSVSAEAAGIAVAELTKAAPRERKREKRRGVVMAIADARPRHEIYGEFLVRRLNKPHSALFFRVHWVCERRRAGSVGDDRPRSERARQQRRAAPQGRDHRDGGM